MIPIPPCIKPDWPAPPGVLALSTTRYGGCSAAPYASFNLGCHVQDAPAAVAANRARLGAVLPPGVALSWLSQVHGAAVVAACSGAEPAADAQWSRQAGIACAVLTADCLPVLLCSMQGDVVAAAHAGWRGLRAGVLEAAVAAMHIAPQNLLAWLGPAIGPHAFEVGPEVRAAFIDAVGAHAQGAVARCFCANAARPGHWFADLYALARLRLHALGVSRIFGGDYCTYTDSARFYSYRRDGETGRMASLILLR